ncbi:MAG TPA: lipase maturation factor family protein, partial [Chloroflexota bacterium]
MGWFDAPDYWLSRFIFERALAAIYLIAFLVAANQFPALLGEYGLLPVRRFTRLVSVRESPSIFFWHYSDRFLLAVSWFGVVLSAALIAGVPQSGPTWAPMLAWFVLWALYLSIVNVGQVFYGFGWETLLLEAGFIAIFLGPARSAPSILVIYLIRWLLFR